MSLGDLSTVIAIGMFVIAVVGSAFGFWRWVAGTLRAVEAEWNSRLVVQQAQIDMTRVQLAEFKLEVAKNYASDDRLERMEVKFTLAFDKLIGRFDAFATDFHKVVGRMERANQDQHP